MDFFLIKVGGNDKFINGKFPTPCTTLKTDTPRWEHSSWQMTFPALNKDHSPYALEKWNRCFCRCHLSSTFYSELKRFQRKEARYSVKKEKLFPSIELFLTPMRTFPLKGSLNEIPLHEKTKRLWRLTFVRGETHGSIFVLSCIHDRTCNRKFASVKKLCEWFISEIMSRLKVWEKDNILPLFTTILMNDWGILIS